LEPIHLRHFYIQKNRGEILLEQVTQRFRSGVCQYQILSQSIQSGFERDEILRRIVHQQDLDPILDRLVAGGLSGCSRILAP